MRRKLRPAAASRVEYPNLERARRLLCGAALAGSLLGGTSALGDITPPPVGHKKEGVLVQDRQLPKREPRLDGEIARPVPPPPGLPPMPQPPQPKKVDKK